MASHDKYDLSVSIKGEEVFFELSTLNPGSGSEDNLGLDTLRIEMTTAKIFHKLINYISDDKDLFVKEDFKLLGEILGKIIFKGKIAQFVLNSLFPKEKDPPECLRIYLEINNNPQLADLPWEYIQVWPGEKIEKLGEQSIYLSANEKSRFQLIRRLNRLPAPVPNSEKLNVILVICNGSNRNEGITSPSSESIVKVFENLKKKYTDLFNFIIINNPEKENFTQALVDSLKQFKGDSDTVPTYCIHYFGHSRLKRGEGELVFKTNTLEATWIKDEDFAGFFDKIYLALKCNEDNDSGIDIKVDIPFSVLFQSCDSGRVGDLSKGKGVAIAMAKKNIPAVIGMQNEIDPESSSVFSRNYYESLLRGCDVAEAVTNGRFFLGCKYNVTSAKDIFGNNEFGSPVLFINTLEPIALLKKKIPENVDGGKPSKKCSHCKAENDIDAKYCKNCARPFQDQRVEKNVSDENQLTGTRRSTGANPVSEPKKVNQKFSVTEKTPEKGSTAGFNPVNEFGKNISDQSGGEQITRGAEPKNID